MGKRRIELADNGWVVYICPSCGYKIIFNVHVYPQHYRYCPQCGMEMKNEKKEEDTNE